MAEKKETKTTRKAEFYNGTGRRKRAVARVWLYDKRGDLIVNDRPIADYFADVPDADKIYMRPLQVTMMTGLVSASIKVQGGGRTGQLGAVVHGLARALVKLNSELKPALKKEKLLTRDSRETERKKPYLRKARKRPQFSKR